MNNLSTLFAARFFGRTDAVAVLAHWGKPCPVDACGQLDQLLDGHLQGKNAQPFSVYRLDEGHKKEQLRGPFRIGSYVPDTEGNTPWLCIDIDGPPHANAVADPTRAALRVRAAFEAVGIPVYVEVSGGGSGRHLWVFCDHKVSASKIRQLAFALIPRDIPLSGGGYADPECGTGIEVFPKCDQIAEGGYGNMVWLPCWQGATPGANQFCSVDESGALKAYTPESFETIDESVVDGLLDSFTTQSQETEQEQEYEPSGLGRESHDWSDWRQRALAALSLEAVYGQWLTGKQKSKGWNECRIPWSPTGDRHPSGSVADGSGKAERGAFHDFRASETISVFDFLIRTDQAADFKEARAIVAKLSGVAEPVYTHSEDPPPAKPAVFVKEQGVDPHRLARRFVNKRCRRDGVATLRFWRHEWWRWNGVCYRTIDTEELRAQLTAFAKLELDSWCVQYSPDKPAAMVSKHLVANTLQALTGMLVVGGDTEQPVWLDEVHGPGICLSLRNGLLDLDALIRTGRSRLIAHSPAFFSSIHLPFDYNPNAKCPRWIKFLDEMLEKDLERIHTLQEWFGYCLTPDTSLQKFLMLEGEGANGKSVICNLLAAMLGAENVSHVPLEMFGQRFQLSGTLGKLANIASEVGELDRADEGVLKAFTAGDRMFFDRKGIPGIQALPTARLVLATNNRPRFADRSSGLWRRMLLLPMRVCIPVEKQNSKLDEQLIAELPGVFNWSIEGLRRLHASGRFTVGEISEQAVSEYRTENNPARMYLLEYTQSDPSSWIACQELFKSYKEWCDANGYRHLGERSFGKEVVRVHPSVKRNRGGSRESREYRYQGLSVSHVS